MEFLLFQNWDPILMMDVLGVVTCGTLILLLRDRCEPECVATQPPDAAGTFLGEVAARLIRQETRRAVETLQSGLAAHPDSGTSEAPILCARIRGEATTRSDANGHGGVRRRPPGRSIYARARQMAEVGIQPVEIARRIALPLCEIELIAKIHRQGNRVDAGLQNAMAA